MSPTIIVQMAARVTLFCNSYVSATSWAPSDAPMWQLITPPPSYTTITDVMTPPLRPSTSTQLHVLWQCSWLESHHNMLSDTAYRNRKYRMVREERPGCGLWNKYKEPARLTVVCWQGLITVWQAAVFIGNFFSYYQLKTSDMQVVHCK